MKKINLKTLRNKSLKELSSEAEKKRLELLSEVASFKSGKSSKPNKKRLLRLDIARISTIIREKELFERSKNTQQTTKTEGNVAEKK